MQALFPYSTTLRCLAILKPTFGKRPHNTLTPTPESQVGASEHASTSADDKISLDEVIAKFKATADEDIRAREILAAATTLRDSTGRERKDAFRKMGYAKRRWGRKKDASHASNSVLLEVLRSVWIRWHASQSTP